MRYMFTQTIWAIVYQKSESECWYPFRWNLYVSFDWSFLNKNLYQKFWKPRFYGSFRFLHMKYKKQLLWEKLKWWENEKFLQTNNWRLQIISRNIFIGNSFKILYGYVITRSAEIKSLLYQFIELYSRICIYHKNCTHIFDIHFMNN